MSERTFIGACGTVGKQDTKLLYSDFPLKKSSTEPVETVAAALLAIGFQKEAIGVLVEKTAVATAKRRARTATGGDLRARAAQALDHVRKTVPGADDEFVLALASGEAIPWRSGFFSHEVSVLKLVKAHDGRQHPETGRFTPMTAPRQTKVEGITWVHADTRRGIPWAPDGTGKGAPADTGEAPATPYDSTSGDRAGAVPTPSTLEGLRARTLT